MNSRLITKNQILAWITIGSFAVGIAFLTLDSPYWLVSVPFFVIAVLIPTVSIMWKVSCWLDYQVQRFLRDENNK